MNVSDNPATGERATMSKTPDSVARSSSRCSPAVPDRVGVWRLTERDGEVSEIEVYELPTGELCAWCEDVGLSGGIDESLCWGTDEWVGHIPVRMMQNYGSFEFIC